MHEQRSKMLAITTEEDPDSMLSVVVAKSDLVSVLAPLAEFISNPDYRDAALVKLLEVARGAIQLIEAMCSPTAYDFVHLFQIGEEHASSSH